jgi:hypothetical protein
LFIFLVYVIFNISYYKISSIFSSGNNIFNNNANDYFEIEIMYFLIKLNNLFNCFFNLLFCLLRNFSCRRIVFFIVKCIYHITKNYPCTI